MENSRKEKEEMWRKKKKKSCMQEGRPAEMDAYSFQSTLAGYAAWIQNRRTMDIRVKRLIQRLQQLRQQTLIHSPHTKCIEMI